MNENDIKRFAEMVNESHRAVFFGGAGVSTESGVKDYRSENGLYSVVKEYGISPEIILSHSFFFEHTDIFYDFFNKYFLSYNVEPNAAHKCLVRLENIGKLSAVITQNIDGLHQKAGSKNVLELHGTIKSYHCSKCRKHFFIDYVNAFKGKIPVCDKCGGIIKPDVVLYEESLDNKVIDKTIYEISLADLLIVGGTSLAVYPAASFLRYFNGDKIVLINKGETSLDSKANIVFRDNIGEVFTNLMQYVEQA